MQKRVYLIGSLRNEAIPKLGVTLRNHGFEVFDDWFAAGPEADDYWQKYERQRGRTYNEALRGAAANHVFRFDKSHLDRCDAAVLVLPAGKSGHLELGYAAGLGKETRILLDPTQPADRWDVMYRFANSVESSVPDLIRVLKEPPR